MFSEILNPIAALCVLFNFGLSYLLGLGVKLGWYPSFVSRKILHISFFLLPYYFGRELSGQFAVNFAISFSVLTTLRYALYVERVRRRVRFLEVSFLAYERIEDRPYNLHYLFFQRVVQLLFINLPAVFLPEFFRPSYMYQIAFMILVFGDGLAEPVGRWVKSPKYSVFTLWLEKPSHRSWAGSVCVYVVSFICVVAYYPSDRPEFVLQLILLPLIATSIEALAPHSLDNPFILLGSFWFMRFIQNLVGGV